MASSNSLLNSNALARKLIYFFVTLIFFGTVTAIAYIHERDINTIVENKMAIRELDGKHSSLNTEVKSYIAEDKNESEHLAKEITRLANAVTKLTESVIRLEEKTGKR